MPNGEMLGEYEQAIRELSELIVAAQKPIRILDSIKWTPSTEKDSLKKQILDGVHKLIKENYNFPSLPLDSQQNVLKDLRNMLEDKAANKKENMNAIRDAFVQLGKERDESKVDYASTKAMAQLELENQKAAAKKATIETKTKHESIKPKTKPAPVQPEAHKNSSTAKIMERLPDPSKVVDEMKSKAKVVQTGVKTSYAGAKSKFDSIRRRFSETPKSAEPPKMPPKIGGSEKKAEEIKLKQKPNPPAKPETKSEQTTWQAATKPHK